MKLAKGERNTQLATALSSPYITEAVCSVPQAVFKLEDYSISLLIAYLHVDNPTIRGCLTGSCMDCLRDEVSDE